MEILTLKKNVPVFQKLTDIKASIWFSVGKGLISDVLEELLMCNIVANFRESCYHDVAYLLVTDSRNATHMTCHGFVQ